ncbi:hypothetical protein DFP72DRAFT_1065091 [Ephemerocybe angulata]|uniref:Uncharacterized protein n=1 Tax=Ephemerocybe angulata TaxID=980116 RepID=A0A8H6I6T7_9AGAR|nr:hypothetical protein DFP72DRAFT_1065091 [Tulosesus angulatus]
MTACSRDDDVPHTSDVLEGLPISSAPSWHADLDSIDSLYGPSIDDVGSHTSHRARLATTAEYASSNEVVVLDCEASANRRPEARGVGDDWKRRPGRRREWMAKEEKQYNQRSVTNTLGSSRKLNLPSTDPANPYLASLPRILYKIGVSNCPRAYAPDIDGDGHGTAHASFGNHSEKVETTTTAAKKARGKVRRWMNEWTTASSLMLRAPRTPGHPNHMPYAKASPASFSTSTTANHIPPNELVPRSRPLKPTNSSHLSNARPSSNLAPLSIPPSSRLQVSLKTAFQAHNRTADAIQVLELDHDGLHNSLHNGPDLRRARWYKTLGNPANTVNTRFQRDQLQHPLCGIPTTRAVLSSCLSLRTPPSLSAPGFFAAAVNWMNACADSRFPRSQAPGYGS